MKFFDTEISRMVLGVNPFCGYAHYNNNFSGAMKDWYTPERVCAVMHDAARYGINADERQRGSESWRWRSAAFSSVAINLPRIGYRAEGNQLKVFELLTTLLELAAQASLEKRVFLEKLLARGEAGSLAMLAMRPDKEPFLRLSWTTHAICPIGLNELTQIVTGAPLDDSPAVQDFASRVIAHLSAEARRLSEKHKVRFLLAESRDVNAPHRLARLDVNGFGEPAIKQLGVATGGIEDVDEAFYTNSVKLPVGSAASALEKAKIEGELQGGMVWNATSDLWLGSALPPAERLAVFISRAFYQTQTAALIFSPEFTICGSE